ncbi:response regulator [Aureimonas sp. SA4125]|uniref:sensor domain-containing diguanylate cyclase n=1 Tax=Aureimonas sp. SA4125 TaxID=2826993 RepID=UPI001CC7BB98|nr:GGDEF domain-containing protein [Aureimonas sp. SA4125]BDA86630.1 response regulator [Aureimonas sp. SA4125]
MKSRNSTLAALSGDRLSHTFQCRNFHHERGHYHAEQSGWLLATSSPATAGRNISRTELFKKIRKADDRALVIGNPVRDPETGRWDIVVGHRVTRPDGSFGGILSAAIDASYFSNVYATLAGSQGGHAALMSRDGTVLSRYPFLADRIGTKIMVSPNIEAVSRGEFSESIRSPSPVTGEDRLQAFSVVADQPIYVVFTLSVDQILASWRSDLMMRLPILFCVICIVGGAGLQLSRQADRRQVVEAGLVELSRTDALTGLFNRRDFNETMPQFWTRCREAGRPLSLLMIDVDCFKPFNDTYGHQAGDTCLQLVSMAVQQCVSSTNERVIRYGGEEIAVILPDAPEARAHKLAEAIRRAVIGLAIQHETSTVTDVVTVSIGAATETWSCLPRQSPGELIDDADRALYRAKIGGRNRVVSNDQTGFDELPPKASLRVIATV